MQNIKTLTVVVRSNGEVGEHHETYPQAGFDSVEDAMAAMEEIGVPEWDYNLVSMLYFSSGG